MAEINVMGFGFNEVEAVTGAKTLDLTDCGVVQNITATATITLPATSAKYNFIIRVGAEGITVTISPNANDKIAGHTATNTGAGTDNKDLILTSAPAGSFVQLQGDGTDGYTITRLSVPSGLSFEA
ncbi:MAG TPA: hypothetical protein VJ836_00760 [Candidatus Saccharimonadales bacterium]|nr:hypothetical protein [Candidatus Saccharimonadales bacterium]